MVADFFDQGGRHSATTGDSFIFPLLQSGDLSETAN
jgi:hypothetical protein